MNGTHPTKPAAPQQAAEQSAPATGAAPANGTAAQASSTRPQPAARHGLAQRVRSRFRLLRETSLVVKSGLFDADWYLAQYPEIAKAGLSPLEHFLEKGAFEGRNPNARFDSAFYLAQNPDVAKAGHNPLIHYLRWGWTEGRDPHPGFSTSFYLRDNPDVARTRKNPLSHYVRYGAGEGRPGVPPAGEALEAAPLGQATTAHAQLAHRFEKLQPLRLELSTTAESHLTLVAEELGAGDRAGAAAILATLLAASTGRPLRVLTRSHKPERLFDSLLAPGGLDGRPLNAPRFFADDARSAPLRAGPNELLLTTSWTATYRALRSVPARQIVWLVQEDERLAYPFGDDHLRCSETLQEPGLRFVVATRTLFDHLHAEGFINLAERGVPFEPAFPLETFHPGPRRGGEKRKLLFVGSPGDLRHLYLRGLEALELAVARGSLDPRQWELYFLGKAQLRLSLSSGQKPRPLEPATAQELAAVVRTMDAGLCLSTAPHPGLLPLQLVACGAVALTNHSKADSALAAASKNILCADLSVAALAEGIAAATRLAQDETARAANFHAQSIPRDWKLAFAEVLAKLSP